MRILLLAFLALLFLIPVLLLCVTIVRRVAKAKWRLSIRGLLLFIAVLAVIMAGTIGYRRMAMARVEWLNPASVQAEHIFPNAEVVKRDDGRIAFTYYAKNRRVQRL